MNPKINVPYAGIRAQIYIGLQGTFRPSARLHTVVPGVKVTIKDLNTGVETKTVTNNAGNYVAAFLNPSKYAATFLTGWLGSVKVGLLVQAP